MLMTMGWLGVNTWVVLDLVLGIFKEMGYDHPGTGKKYAVGIGIMAVQVVIAIFGFYLIQTFEKYTVPVAVVIMGVMSVLAWTKADVAWTHSTVHGGDKWTAITQLTTAFGAASIPVLFLITHGPVATNILNLYSASLAALSLDIKVKRWIVSVVA